VVKVRRAGRRGRRGGRLASNVSRRQWALAPRLELAVALPTPDPVGIVVRPPLSPSYHGMVVEFVNVLVAAAHAVGKLQLLSVNNPSDRGTSPRS